jgi:myo-inositol catabolism protein IolC
MSMPLTKVMLFIVEKPEDVAALRLRQQEELYKRAQEIAQKKKELLQQRRLMRIAEHNQKFQSMYILSVFSFEIRYCDGF